MVTLSRRGLLLSRVVSAEEVSVEKALCLREINEKPRKFQSQLTGTLKREVLFATLFSTKFETNPKKTKSRYPNNDLTIGHLGVLLVFPEVVDGVVPELEKLLLDVGVLDEERDEGVHENVLD